MSIEKRSGNLHKVSLVLSVSPILFTITLFVRMQAVMNDTKMMDSKFSLEIQQIKDALKADTAQNAIVFRDMYLQCPVFWCAE